MNRLPPNRRDGDAVIPVINALMDDSFFEFVVATQDWHPADHGSFAENHGGRQAGEVIELIGIEQTLWPVHCVQGSQGGEFSPALNTDRFDAIFPKGTDSRVDSYSGFYDNGRQHKTGLARWLKDNDVSEVFVAGLATDYCVKSTALDAREEGFRTILIEDGCRGVDLEPGDVTAALEAMQLNGVEIRLVAEIFAEGVTSQ